MRAIVWLKRDLRLEDNRVFEEANNYKEVIPVFILDDQILSNLKAYDERLVYILQALHQLGIRVYLFKGDTTEIFERLIYQLKPDAVITQKAYTWSCQDRVQKVRNLCERHQVKFVEVLDGFFGRSRNYTWKESIYQLLQRMGKPFRSEKVRCKGSVCATVEHKRAGC